MLKKKPQWLQLFCMATTSVLPYSANAAVTDEWRVCTAILDNASRLACFDTVAAHNFAQTPEPTQTAGSLSTSSTVATTVAETMPEKAEAGTLTIAEQDRQDQQILASVGGSADAYTPLSLLYDLDRNDDRGTFILRAHRPSYFLPVWYNNNRNSTPSTPTQPTYVLYDGDVQNTEAKFQLSFKTKVMEDLFGARMDVWFAYTQQSHWQVYNKEWSAPFRGTDYEPELFVTQPVKMELPLGLKLRVLGGGIVHQSNGQTDPLSRSWNRVYGMAGLEWGKVTIVPRLWWRVPEQSSHDDNPDIIDYMGYGDLQLIYHHGQQSVSLLTRYNPDSNKGAVRVEYAFPLAGHLKGYIQYFNGYGESLIDYNFRNRSIGIGVMLNEWSGF